MFVFLFLYDSTKRVSIALSGAGWRALAHGTVNVPPAERDNEHVEEVVVEHEKASY